MSDRPYGPSTPPCPLFARSAHSYQLRLLGRGALALALQGDLAGADALLSLPASEGMQRTRRAILEAAGRPTGVIGTLSGVRTTPEAPDLQRQLAQMRDAGRPAGNRGALEDLVEPGDDARLRPPALTFREGSPPADPARRAWPAGSSRRAG